MSEDKRLNEVIRVQKRPNNYTMIDTGFLNNSELSWKAKGILAYLLSKPDNWKVIIKDLVNHATDGKAAVYSGLNELKDKGHYQKSPVRDSNGRRISHWEGTVSEVPMESLVNTPSSLLTNFQEIENQDIDNQKIENLDIENQERSNIYKSKIYSSYIDGSVETPTPKKQRRGKFKHVMLTEAEHDELVATYGRTKTFDYINRLDRQIECKDFRSKNHHCTIEKWIAEDDIKAKEKPAPKPASTPNRFANFEQRDWKADQLSQLETLYLQKPNK